MPQNYRQLSRSKASKYEGPNHPVSTGCVFLTHAVDEFKYS
jgi:hypothetical protein